MQLLSKEWRELSIKEKQRFQELAKQEKIKYQNYKKSKQAKKAKKQKLDLPKSPLAPFTLFQIEQRKQHPEQFQNMGIVDVTKILSQKWKELPETTKGEYRNLFTSEKQKYDKQVHTLKVKALKKEKTSAKKKPVHQPFVGYIKARYGELHQAHPKLKHSDVIRLLSVEWKSLTKEEKDSFKPVAFAQDEHQVQLIPETHG